MRTAIAGVAAALVLVAPALAATRQELIHLQAPPPAPVPTPIAGAHPIMLTRIVEELRPEPWALLSLGRAASIALSIGPADDAPHPRVPVVTERLVTWNDGSREVSVREAAPIFADELRTAGVPDDDASGSLFEHDSRANLMLAVKITDMKAHLCQWCTLFGPRENWGGVVMMTARWEIYSSLEHKVVATVETQGGYTAPTPPVAGGPTALINEALRDNLRRLIASEEFRRAVTADAAPPSAGAARAKLEPISLKGARHGATRLDEAAAAVVTIFAGQGMGSAVLVSSDGYLLTNHHVVGAEKAVRVRWSDGFETTGEVIRSDRARDVALVKTDPHGRAPLALDLATPALGAPVFAIGTPLDPKLQNTVTRGIVSGSRMIDGFRFIQSDTPVTHGNSGGPLLDERGAVIGLTDWGVPPQEGSTLNFFIPIGDALDFLALRSAPEMMASSRGSSPAGGRRDRR